jgi:glycine/D-amino acid oxidase-like deaminating enzyme
VTRILVVGAGIVGAAVAYESARAGADVHLLDKNLPASGVTRHSFAWIGGPSGADEPDASTPLRERATAEYRRLEDEVPGVEVRWRGSLVWGGDAGRPSSLGPGEHLVEAAEVGRVEPHVARPPAQAVHRTGDGAVDPIAVTEALVRAAQNHGARLITGCTATALRLRDKRVVGVESSDGPHAADTVVLAAGVDAPMLCAQLGFPLAVAPSLALLMRFAGPHGLVRTLVSTSELEVREGATGELLVAARYDGQRGRHELTKAGEEMLQRLTATFGDGHGLRLVSVQVGARPMPADGLPFVGPVPGVLGAYAAVLHSGVTLGPAVGRLVAQEVVLGHPASELSGLRLDRAGRLGT